MRHIKALILRVLDEHRVTLATNRPDGWPQATMVGYVNDGYLLYCFVARCDGCAVLPLDHRGRACDNARRSSPGSWRGARADRWLPASWPGRRKSCPIRRRAVGRNTQKYANVLRDPRVSAAIGSDAPNPLDITGLSLAGRATEVVDQSEFDDAAKLRLKRYPEYSALPQSTLLEGAPGRIAPRPSPASTALLRIAPEVISVLDYSKGFGHSDLVTFSERDLDVHLSGFRHRWTGEPSAN